MSTEKEDGDDGGGAAATHSTVSLRGDAFLKEAVTKRPQAQGIADGKDSSADEDILPKVSNKKQTMSGREWTAADLVKVAVKWPHYHTIFGPRKDKAAYDDLTVTEFIHGFITIPWTVTPILVSGTLSSAISSTWCCMPRIMAGRLPDMPMASFL